MALAPFTSSELKTINKKVPVKMGEISYRDDDSSNLVADIRREISEAGEKKRWWKRKQKPAPEPKKELPSYLKRHQDAQEAGHFRP